MLNFLKNETDDFCFFDVDKERPCSASVAVVATNLMEDVIT